MLQLVSQRELINMPEEHNLPGAVWAKLDLLISEQSKTNLMLKEVSGKQELLSEIAKFQAEKLNEHKLAVNKIRDEDMHMLRSIRIDVEARISALEKWKYWMVGLGAGIAVVIHYLLDILKVK